jgi:hypothetical protein
MKTIRPLIHVRIRVAAGLAAVGLIPVATTAAAPDTTNPALPVSDWTTLGDPKEGPPGHYQFTELQATNFRQRFNSVRSP